MRKKGHNIQYQKDQHHLGSIVVWVLLIKVEEVLLLRVIIKCFRRFSLLLFLRVHFRGGRCRILFLLLRRGLCRITRIRAGKFVRLSWVLPNLRVDLTIKIFLWKLKHFMMIMLTKNNKFMISTRKNKPMRGDCQVLKKYQDQEVKLKYILTGKIKNCIKRKYR